MARAASNKFHDQSSWVSLLSIQSHVLHPSAQVQKLKQNIKLGPESRKCVLDKMSRWKQRWASREAFQLASWKYFAPAREKAHLAASAALLDVSFLHLSSPVWHTTAWGKSVVDQRGGRMKAIWLFILLWGLNQSRIVQEFKVGFHWRNSSSGADLLSSGCSIWAPAINQSIDWSIGVVWLSLWLFWLELEHLWQANKPAGLATSTKFVPAVHSNCFPWNLETLPNGWK